MHLVFKGALKCPGLLFYFLQSNVKCSQYRRLCDCVWEALPAEKVGGQLMCPPHFQQRMCLRFMRWLRSVQLLTCLWLACDLPLPVVCPEWGGGVCPTPICPLDSAYCPFHFSARWRPCCVHVFTYWCRVSGGELFEDIVQRAFYTEADARLACDAKVCLVQPRLTLTVG